MKPATDSEIKPASHSDFHSSRHSDLKAATFRTDPRSDGCLDLVLFDVKLAMFPRVLELVVFSYFHQ